MCWSGWMKFYKIMVMMEDVCIDMGVYIKKKFRLNLKVIFLN